MQTAHIVIIALLLVVATCTRATYVLARKIAASNNIENPGICATILDGCPMASYCPGMAKHASPSMVPSLPSVLAPAAATTSGFEASDFLQHAREMDVRKLRTGSPSSPAKKMEALMMDNDHAQRKLRSKLIRGG